MNEIVNQARTVPVEQIPNMLGDLAAAEAILRLRLTEFQRPGASPNGLVPLNKDWAHRHGLELDTARRLARRGRLNGAVAAPSAGRGKRHRWLVPNLLTELERSKR
jgi:hypothetical protein